jgi:hypothetical protein
MARRHGLEQKRAPIPVLHVSGAWMRRLLRAAERDPTEAMRAYQRQADEGTLKLDRLPKVRLSGRVRLKRRRAPVANVIGRLEGAGNLADEAVVIGAHYDHLGKGRHGSLGGEDAEGELHPGADDNASGTAGLIMLAEHFGQAGPGQKPDDRRALVFAAFTGEERGLRGARHFMRNLAEVNLQRADIAAMINLDMIGRLRDAELHALHTETAKAWAPLLLRAGEHAGIRVTSAGGPPDAVSDHTPFLRRGIPAVHLFTGLHDDYHRPSDTYHEIATEGGAAVVELTAHLIKNVRKRQSAPRFREAKTPAAPPDHPIRLRAEARLGILIDPDSVSGEDGVRVTAVRADSPAAEAEVAAGDRILRWEDRPVPNAEVLMRRVARGEHGEELELTVFRAGERKTRTIELEEP